MHPKNSRILNTPQLIDHHNIKQNILGGPTGGRSKRSPFYIALFNVYASKCAALNGETSLLLFQLFKHSSRRDLG